VSNKYTDATKAELNRELERRLAIIASSGDDDPARKDHPVMMIAAIPSAAGVAISIPWAPETKGQTPIQSGAAYRARIDG
jgi:hypothetical protein